MFINYKNDNIINIFLIVAKCTVKSNSFKN